MLMNYHIFIDFVSLLPYLEHNLVKAVRHIFLDDDLLVRILKHNKVYVV